MRWRTVVAGAVVVVMTCAFCFWQSRRKHPTPAGASAAPVVTGNQIPKYKFEVLVQAAQVCDLRFKPTELNPNEFAPFIELTAPDAAKRAADYQARVTGECERILRPENLIDAKERKRSRDSLFESGLEMFKYWRVVLDDIEWPSYARRESSLGDSRAWEGWNRTVRFHNLQFQMEAEERDDFGDILDLMDRAGDVKLDGQRLVFSAQRDEEDFNRLISRLRRLEALRAQRRSDLQERLLKQPKNGLPLTQPPGQWDYLINSGATIELDEGKFLIEGKPIVLPIAKTDLVAKLGQPREVAGQTIKLVWDHWGIVAMQESGTSMINRLLIALRPRNEQDWPKEVVRGRLALLGNEIDENSTPWSLNHKHEFRRREFVCMDSAAREWMFTVNGCKVTTDFKPDGTIDSLVICASN